MRARKTASFGVPYDYNQMTYEPLPMPSSINNLCDLIAGDTSGLGIGFRPNGCLLNYYVNRDSSIGFHSDSAVNLAPNTGVIVISLGSIRTMIFREKNNRENEYKLDLLPGSLLYMSMDMQSEWLHGIPKEFDDSHSKSHDASDSGHGRISITLRCIVKE
jgi:alkylated DNA repair dioxygenase AlkB